MAERRPSRLQRLRSETGDLARWAFWVKLREALDPARPEQIRALYPLWRAQHGLSAGKQAILHDEYRRCFGDLYTPAGYRRLVADAARVAWRVHLEELLLGKVTAETVPHYLRLEGREHLDAALAAGRGAILLSAHAGNFMMMIAAISLAGYSYTQYAARGLAPPEVAEANPEVFGHNRWREATRAAREQNEDRLPASFISLDTPIRHLYRCLERNECIGVAFDGRIGRKFSPISWLGRTALVNPGPYRMAAATGAAIVPALCHTPAEGPGICTLGRPIFPTEAGQTTPEALLSAFLAVAQPWMLAHPEEYGTWLAHCRLRAGVDDHPFFVDYAPDERYRPYLARARSPEAQEP